MLVQIHTFALLEVELNFRFLEALTFMGSLPAALSHVAPARSIFNETIHS